MPEGAPAQPLPFAFPGYGRRSEKISGIKGYLESGSERGQNGRAGRAAAWRDEELDLLARLLDDVFRIPGTRIRFGLDALLGLIPGLGDAITGVASLVILFAGWRRGLPRVALARMLVNVGLDVIVGVVPLLGDVFDVVWKVNRRNVTILRRYAGESERAETWRDWTFLLALVAGALAILVAPLVLLVWAASWLWGARMW